MHKNKLSFLAFKQWSQTSNGKRPNQALWAGSRAARGLTTITNCLNYCVSFIIYIYIYIYTHTHTHTHTYTRAHDYTNVAKGRITQPKGPHAARGPRVGDLHPNHCYAAMNTTYLEHCQTSLGSLQIQPFRSRISYHHQVQWFLFSGPTEKASLKVMYGKGFWFT